MRAPIPGFRGHLLTAIVVVVVAVGWMLFLLGTGGGLPSLNDPYRMHVAVPTSASLAANARVTMAGVEVGRVEAVERRGPGALVKLEIEDDSVTPLPADSRVAIRQRTPLGENYVSIERGASPTALRSGAILSADQADDYVDVDQILSVLKGRTRARARELIQGFGGALAGRGEELNRLVEGTSRTVDAGAAVALVLARDRRQLARLIQQFGEISSAVGERGAAMRMLAQRGLVTFRAVAGRDDAVRDMLDELPSMLGRVRSSTRTLASVSGRAAPVLDELAAGVRELRPAVALLTPAAREGQAVLRELAAAGPPLERTLVEVRALARPLASAMPPLRGAFCELNPLLRYLRPYAPDVIATYVGLGAAMKSYDATGHLMRATPVVTEQALTGLPPEVHAAALTLARAGLLERTRELGYDPYPPPGAVGSNPDGSGVLGPEQVQKPFPRIPPDC